jgi:uncharacterized surface protein with fasciclin (FAS1) repeats
MKKLMLALAAGSLLLAACGDDNDDEAAPTAAESESEAPAPQADLVETAAGAGDFTTLATALEAAGLVETLQGEGPYTVFAPTDAAFEDLPDGALDELLADPEALSDVLLYHVVEGEVPASDVVELDGQSVATVNGAEVEVSVDGEAVQVNEAGVTQTDIAASNGIIHVIDAVLLPPA